jgi:hypothetical protein
MAATWSRSAAWTLRTRTASAAAAAGAFIGRRFS